MPHKSQFQIKAIFPNRKFPHLQETGDPTIKINKTSKASLTRCRDIYVRAHLYAAGAFEDCTQIEVHARDLFPPDEYGASVHREKILNGMVLGYLCRMGFVPLSVLPYKSYPRRYRILADRIDFDLYNKIMARAAA